MSATGKSGSMVLPVRPMVLVVDDEPGMTEMLGDVVGAMDCTVVKAANIAEARRIIARESVQVMVADMKLPDGDGMSLLRSLRKYQPSARAIVMTGEPTVAAATEAIRHGAVDFVAKPFDAKAITAHVRSALSLSEQVARQDQKIVKLKRAVKRLNAARKTISQKVDILCNDLVSAYGELSKQFDVLRTQESFRKTIEPARDLEQLICQSMDWLMRQLGYSNVAVWLVGDDGGYQLGAYMKYTIPGDEQVSEILRRVVLPLAARDGRDTPMKFKSSELADKLSPKEQQLMKDQEILTIDCTYLGESLAAIVFFRDEHVPFSEPDLDTLRSVSPIFASALATIVRGAETDAPEPTGAEDSFDSNSDGGGTYDPKKRKSNKPDPADWWKRGEEPPF
ncbi:response regulator [Humisphaera borealis]|uniref:Response regulator n=1 Tax=Humisphaera borealis TaxID=2807512 RepID=A0A7M2X246_9BACT|nr:response regulator [Humisphaera borealis]QOV91765.1 response regulator [Humisphaera borealis]